MDLAASSRLANPSLPTRPPVRPGVQRFYNAMARHGGAAPFLNYGFCDPGALAALDERADDDAVAPLGAAGDAQLVAVSRALYARLFAGLPLAGARVLELGCGRGGGAAVLLDEHRPVSYLGVDLGHLHVALCRRRFAARGAARFVVGDAERPPVPAGAFDVVVSLEAIHHFEQPARFFTAVRDALAPGGVFAVAGIFDAAALPDAALAASGLDAAAPEDLTPGVLRSLALTSAHRRGLVEHLPLPLRFRPFLLSWAGVAGSPVYRRFELGSLRYLRYVAVRRA